MIRCTDCDKLVTQKKSIKGLCRKCYNKRTNKKYYATHIMHKTQIGDECISLNIEKDIITNEEAKQYVDYKRDEIFADMLKNPKKYLDQV